MRFGFWTGPCVVDQVALRLSEAGFQDVRAGTEKVYFRLPPTWEQPVGLGGGLLRAQDAVNEVYPHAGFRVYEV